MHGDVFCLDNLFLFISLIHRVKIQKIYKSNNQIISTGETFDKYSNIKFCIVCSVHKIKLLLQTNHFVVIYHVWITVQLYSS